MINRRFTHRNESFVCAHCQTQNPAANQTCRNHCRECLYSQHLDKLPGDRQANCGGMMTPIKIIKTATQEGTILFQCDSCGHQHHNKVADDDSQTQIWHLWQKSAVMPIHKGPKDKYKKHYKK